MGYCEERFSEYKKRMEEFSDMYNKDTNEAVKHVTGGWDGGTLRLEICKNSRRGGVDGRLGQLFLLDSKPRCKLFQNL